MTETNQKTGNPLLVSAALEQSQDAIEHIDCSDTEQRRIMDFLFSGQFMCPQIKDWISDCSKEK